MHLGSSQNDRTFCTSWSRDQLFVNTKTVRKGKMYLAATETKY